MKKVVMIACVGASLFGFSSIGAFCACFSEDTEEKESALAQVVAQHLDAHNAGAMHEVVSGDFSGYNRQAIQFLQTHDRYRIACVNKSVREINRLKNEALWYIHQNVPVGDVHGMRLYNYVFEYAKHDPYRIIKLYLFLLHVLAMNPKNKPQKELSAGAVVAGTACFFYLNLKGSLDCVEFATDQRSMPIMRKVKNEADVSDIYDRSDRRSLSVSSPIIRHHSKVLRRQRGMGRK